MGVLHRNGLSPASLCLDQAEDVIELLILPETFFSTDLTLEQIIDIVMNPNLVAMQMPDDKFIATAMSSGHPPQGLNPPPPATNPPAVAWHSCTMSVVRSDANWATSAGPSDG